MLTIRDKTYFCTRHFLVLLHKLKSRTLAPQFCNSHSETQLELRAVPQDFFLVCYFEEQNQTNVRSVKTVVSVNLCASDTKHRLKCACIAVVTFLDLNKHKAVGGI